MVRSTRLVTALLCGLLAMSCSLLLDNDDDDACTDPGSCADDSASVQPAPPTVTEAQGCAQPCTGETPICDLPSGECVGCVSDADCSQQAPFGVCDPAARRCTECRNDADCDAAGGPPRCDVANQRCVACMEDAHCEGSGVCDTEFEPRCVACKSDTDCEDATASRCDRNRQCVPCENNSHCNHISGRRVCSTQSAAAAQCVQCTAETEAIHCGANVCDLRLHTCTDLRRGTKGTCEPCAYDSECRSDDGPAVIRRCVVMEYKAEAREMMYCLELAKPNCAAPYPSITAKLASASFVAPASYCQPNPDATTCEAVLDLGTEPCTPATQIMCGDPELEDDAACRTVGNNVNRCSLPCASDADCRPPQICSDDMWCE